MVVWLVTTPVVLEIRGLSDPPHVSSWEWYLYSSMIRQKTHSTVEMFCSLVLIGNKYCSRLFVHCYCVLSAWLPSRPVGVTAICPGDLAWGGTIGRPSSLSALLRCGEGVKRILRLGRSSLPLEEAVEVLSCGCRKRTVLQPEEEDSASPWGRGRCLNLRKRTVPQPEEEDSALPWGRGQCLPLRKRTVPPPEEEDSASTWGRGQCLTMRKRTVPQPEEEDSASTWGRGQCLPLRKRTVPQPEEEDSASPWGRGQCLTLRKRTVPQPEGRTVPQPEEEDSASAWGWGQCLPLRKRTGHLLIEGCYAVGSSWLGLGEPYILTS